MPVEEIKLYISGKNNEKNHRITVNTFIEASQTLLSLLKEMEVSFAGAENPLAIKWVISDLGVGSASAVFLGECNSTTSYLPYEILAATMNGMKELETKPYRPFKFSNKAMRYAKDLASMVESENEISIYYDKDAVSLSSHIVSNVNAVLTPLEEINSVEGYLKMISVARKTPHCNIYDVITGSPVHCELEGELLKKAYESFGKRVKIYGLISYSVDGYPLKIRNVTEFEVFPSNNELPTISELLAMDLDLSDGLSLDDYLEKIHEYDS